MSSIIKIFLIFKNVILSQYSIINKLRILIVEDEKKLERYLKKGLEEISYTVDLALNSTDGSHLATHETY